MARRGRPLPHRQAAGTHGRLERLGQQGRAGGDQPWPLPVRNLARLQPRRGEFCRSSGRRPERLMLRHGRHGRSIRSARLDRHLRAIVEKAARATRSAGAPCRRPCPAPPPPSRTPAEAAATWSARQASEIQATAEAAVPDAGRRDGRRQRASLHRGCGLADLAAHVDGASCRRRSAVTAAAIWPSGSGLARDLAGLDVRLPRQGERYVVREAERDARRLEVAQALAERRSASRRQRLIKPAALLLDAGEIAKLTSEGRSRGRRRSMPDDPVPRSIAEPLDLDGLRSTQVGM